MPTKLFPLWAIVFSIFAYFYPNIFSPLAPAIPYLLGVVMLGMGLTLTIDSFRQVVENPRSIFVGVVLQFSVMPLAAWIVATALALPPQLTAGLVLVGASPGGTASNVITYLAGGSLALSISLTAASTLLSVVATPALTWLYVGQNVPVPVWSMLESILIIVIVPVAAGVAANQLWGRRLSRVRRASPLLSIAAIVLIIAIIVARNGASLATLAPAVVLAVALHNGLGLGLGYGASKLLGFPEREARTIAIEVGMQNSGLGVVLAQQYFSPIAAIPGAVFSIWHNLTGSALASLWSRRATSA